MYAQHITYLQIIQNTPFYVWVILAFLVKRGLGSRKKHEVSIFKMCIVPTIFAVWGLYDIVSEFQYVGSSLITYIIGTCVGVTIGYLIYIKNRKVYKIDNKIFVGGTYIPLVIMIINFGVKYILNVKMMLNPLLLIPL